MHSEHSAQGFQHPDSPQSNPSSPHLPGANVTSQQVNWLWPQRIPSGKLTLLDGSPGSGTSLFALHLASCLSTGSPWPDGSPCPQGNVLFIAPHDGVQDTILPRLRATHADLNHIFFLSRVLDSSSANPSSTHPFSLPLDLAILKSIIIDFDIRLLILDPCSAISGLSRSLLDLVHLAQKTSCAFLLTRSLRQPPLDPLHAHGPASPILTAARSHLLLAPDPADERKYLLLTPGHPLCAPADILSYEIAVTAQGIPTLHWFDERPATRLTRLSTGPIRSPHRQAILRFLHNSSTAHTLKDIIRATSYDYEAGRKMLLRMRQAGELVSPARGLYTTAAHPCLANFPAPRPTTVPNVPKSKKFKNELDEIFASYLDSIRPTNSTTSPPSEPPPPTNVAPPPSVSAVDTSLSTSNIAPPPPSSASTVDLPEAEGQPTEAAHSTHQFHPDRFLSAETANTSSSSYDSTLNAPSNTVCDSSINNHVPNVPSPIDHTTTLSSATHNHNSSPPACSPQ